MTLKELQTGHRAIIRTVDCDSVLRQHILDMGLIPGTEVKLMKYAPLGDPMELHIYGYSLTLRKADAAHISILPLDGDTDTPDCTDESYGDLPYIASLHEHNAHPGIGEEGRYHTKEEANPYPKGTVISFALAGNQNCGKTTLFNRITGMNQHVGNFPGVTVDQKSGPIKGYPDTLVTDLPGIYSLSPYTAEEIVSREFILKEKPHGIINIVDASNIERNLYLTVQLMELGVPIVLALNMMDEIRNNGGSIRINEMEKILGIPIVPISASKNEGIEELLEHAIHVARNRETPARKDFCDKEAYGGAVHRCLHSIMHLIEDHAEAAGLPLRFAAGKLVEGDSIVTEALHLTQNELEMIEHIIVQMEAERGLDRAASMADMRFGFIRKLCRQTVVKPGETKEWKRSRKIDGILTGKFAAIPIFIAIMCMVIYLSIETLGAPLQQALTHAINRLAALCAAGMEQADVSPAVRSLIIDSIFKGVGSVLSFIPVIVILFFFLSLIEDSGYMARIAFITDRQLRRIGLSGRSIVPMLIGFGCSVPAVMAARTLPSAIDRRRTILFTPFVSCPAKIPIYAFFAAAFFPGHGGRVLILLYLLGIATGIVVSLITQRLGHRSEPAPFVMELPPYRIPGIRNVAHLLWDKTKDFVQRAFTVIFVATIAIWLLQSFDFRFNMVEESSGSMLARISGVLAPLFRPLGMDDWRLITALLSGFLAKESVVSTMQVLNVTATMTACSAVAMMIFSLLYTPCVATIASIQREIGHKWALLVVVFQCLIAWLAAWIAYMTAPLFL